MSRIRNVKVTLNKYPEGADHGDIAAFVIAALESWGGQLYPNDLLFHSLPVHSVTIGETQYIK